MRRRWKRRLLWAAVLFGVLLLAVPATVSQASAALRAEPTRRAATRAVLPLVALLAVVLAVRSAWPTVG
jgi:hypothetical protein